MPTSQEAKRGGVLRYRTIKPSSDTYIHIAIVRDKGSHGGRTIAGKLREDKNKG